MTTRFIIWTTQRTGSTVFWRTLDRHPRVEAHGEMFLPEMERADAYPPFWTRSRWSRLERRFVPRLSVARYLRELFRGGPGIQAVGFKLMYNHLTPELGAWIQRERPKLVHLVRHNPLKLLASRVAAEQRGLYHLKPGEMAPADRLKLDPVELPARLERIETELSRGRAFTTGTDAMEVAYEDLLAKREATYARAFSFLGIPPSPEPIADPLRKINPDTLADLIENYDEVAARLRGTRFEPWLTR